MSASVEAADRPGSWTVRLDDMDQSHVDLDDPTRLVFDYVRRIGDLLDAASAPGAPLRVLHVGGAGLTLPRYVAATRPGSRQVVLEPDAALTALVRDRLPLPRRSGISVRPEDGRDGLAGVREAWAEAVLVDAFAGAEVPLALVTTQAWREVDRVRVGGAPVVLNVSDRAPFTQTRDVIASMREVLGEVVVGVESPTWRARRPGNLLLVSGAPPPVAGTRTYRWLTGDAVTGSLGGGTPLRDPHRSPGNRRGSRSS